MSADMPDPCPCAGQNAMLSDHIQQLFARPFFLSLTIGVPFCFFKGLFGLAALRTGILAGNLLLAAFGWAVIAWATLDLAMNAWRAMSDIGGREAGIEYCVLAELGRFFGRPAVFLAIDTLLSFAIICSMLWSGWIASLTLPEAYLWYAATTLNLISISAVSLYNEMRKAETGGS